MNDLLATKLVNVTPPAAIIDNSAVATAEIDTAGYDYATIIVQLGATDIAMTVCKVQESDTSGSGFADVTGLVYGTSTDIGGSTSALPIGTDDNKLFLFEIDLRNRKRYLDVAATCGDGAAGTFISILAILSRAKSAPVSVTARGIGNSLRV